MRFRIRFLMTFIALLAVGLSLPNPAVAITLIFMCPLWLLVIAAQSRRGDRDEKPQ